MESAGDYGRRMTTYLLVHGDQARAFLNHPGRTPLREIIRGHEGPWKEEDVARLNGLEFGRLRFAARNGQLHVYLGELEEAKSL